jgi:CelD/BcsL family acetyltransferase involved in cellulose biosynthesis/GNAT superfamily N-acetyltransferase
MNGHANDRSAVNSPARPVAPSWPLRLTRLRDLSAIEMLVPSWDALSAREAPGNPFLTTHWTLSWLRTDPSLQPFVLAAHDGERLVAVWPLALSSSFGRRVLSYVEGDVYGILCAGHDVPAATAAFATALVEDRDEWDVAILSDHIVGSADNESIVSSSRAAGLSVTRLRTADYPYVSLLKDGKYANFEKRVGKKIINEIKRRRRQLEAIAPVRVERARSPAAALARFPEVVDLHRRRWRERSDTSGFSSEPRIAGMRAAAERFARAGCLELDLLLVDEQLVAYSYGFILGDRHVYYSPGFDPAYAPFAVSKILLLDQLTDAFKEGFREFDFSRGAEPYKLAWANESRAGETVVLSHAGPRSQAAAITALAAIRLRMAAKADERVVHFKRETLGKLRARLSLRYVSAHIVRGGDILKRSIEDRGKLGTLRHLAERVAPARHSSTDGRLYARHLSGEASSEPRELGAPPGFSFGVLKPSEYEGLVAAGRYDLREVVRRHYIGQRCFVVRTGEGRIAGYAWYAAGRPVAVPELGGELTLKMDECYLGDCYTRSPFRGQGLYPRLLEYAAGVAYREGKRRAWIAVRESNHASIHGIERAGFERVDGHEVAQCVVPRGSKDEGRTSALPRS